MKQGGAEAPPADSPLALRLEEDGVGRDLPQDAETDRTPRNALVQEQGPTPAAGTIRPLPS